MKTFKPDIVIKIKWHIKDASKCRILTNATEIGLKELLETWLIDRAGSGRDDAKAKKKKIYRIRIGWKVRRNGDQSGVESDTGNLALTVGIVQAALSRVHASDILIRPLR